MDARGPSARAARPDGLLPPFSPALFTDLYELTMLQAYDAEGMSARATFSLFVRRLPPRRPYLLACGLEDVLTYLETLRFDEPSIDYLTSLGRFSRDFLDRLRAFRFTGDVRAVPEGTPVFAGEPILEIDAPIAEGQLVETFVINQVHLQTMLASKASRVVAAAAGRPVVDFGLRRMHGVDAGLKAARAFHVAGVDSTSNVAAGQAYGIPVAGTMAHSYIQAHDDEAAAFRAFARLYPGTILLVDTYDTIGAVGKIIELARTLGPDFRVGGIRLDSGDLDALSREARRLLDAAGLGSVTIFASGGLDEDAVARLVAAGAPIDGFGVGTDMGVSRDVPALDMAYKLVAYAGRARTKLSPGKELLPGSKQIFRVERDGQADHDVIAARDERLDGRPLLDTVMSGGRRCGQGVATLADARARARDELSRLPAQAFAPDGYRVDVSPHLGRQLERLRREVDGSRPGRQHEEERP